MILETILEILKYVLPSLIMLIAVNGIVSKFVTSESRKTQLTIMHENQQVSVRLRLQAYERLALFVERIHPRQLFPRVYEPNMTVREFQQMLTYHIKTEFEHNLAQQVYISKQAWDTIRTVKEQEINMINTIAQQIDPAAPGKELHIKMMDFLLSSETILPTDIALTVINDEARNLLSGNTRA